MFTLTANSLSPTFELMPMSAVTDKYKQSTDLNVLAGFAQFILEHHYEEFLKASLQTIQELKVPLLNFFSREAAEKVSNISNTELLLYLAQNNHTAHIQKAIDRWKANQLRMLNRNEVVVDDITLVGYSRKVTFLKFLPYYTTDPIQIIALMKEVEMYILEYTSTTFKAFVEIMDDRMETHVQRLEESEALYKQAQALTHIGNYVSDLVNNKLTWSDELYRIYELDPSNTHITNAIVGIYNHPEDAEMIKNHINHARETLEPFNFYYRIVLPHGRVKTIHAQGRIITDDQGQRIKMFGTAQDVTEQKEIEKKLLQNQTFIQRIADAIPAIIASYNVHTGKYTFINEGLKKLLDYEPQQVLDEGTTFFMKLVHPEDVELLNKGNNSMLQEADEQHNNSTEPIIEFQYRMKHNNREYRWFHTFVTVFQRNAQGLVEHVLNISLDITERVKAEDILVQRTHELQLSNASLEEFAYVASHDLKEPLRKISLFTDRMARSKAKFTKAEQLNYGKIISASLRMQQMIDDLLSLSLISATSQIEHCNLEEIFQEVIQTFDFKVEELKAMIISDGLPFAEVVPAQMRQLFQNLLSNSLKFTRADATPIIKVTHRYITFDTVLHPGLRPANSYLEIQITDNGIGFEKEFQEKIFAVFQRLHHRHQYEGTGIGLAICRKILKNYGGTIVAEGQPNGGATFTLTLPL